jgi:hypothetical protein
MALVLVVLIEAFLGSVVVGLNQLGGTGTGVGLLSIVPILLGGPYNILDKDAWLSNGGVSVLKLM